MPVVPATAGPTTLPQCTMLCRPGRSSLPRTGLACACRCTAFSPPSLDIALIPGRAGIARRLSNSYDYAPVTPSPPLQKAPGLLHKTPLNRRLRPARLQPVARVCSGRFCRPSRQAGVSPHWLEHTGAGSTGAAAADRRLPRIRHCGRGRACSVRRRGSSARCAGTIR
jgi:hypothetical protein